jgi:hypothetical protein
MGMRWIYVLPLLHLGACLLSMCQRSFRLDPSAITEN